MKTAYRLNADLADTENQERIKLGEIFVEYAKKFRPDGMPDWRDESLKHKPMTAAALNNLQAEMQKVDDKEVSGVLAFSFFFLRIHVFLGIG
jgi:hypothetical protein